MKKKILHVVFVLAFLLLTLPVCPAQAKVKNITLKEDKIYTVFCHFKWNKVKNAAYYTYTTKSKTVKTTSTKGQFVTPYAYQRYSPTVKAYDENGKLIAKGKKEFRTGKVALYDSPLFIRKVGKDYFTTPAMGSAYVKYVKIKVKGKNYSKTFKTSSSSYTVSGLKPNTKYTVSIVGYNPEGSKCSFEEKTSVTTKKK